MNFLARITPSSITVVLIAILLTACFSQEDPPSTAPANVAVTEGSGLVVVDWDVIPGRTYWIFYNQGTNASLDDFDRVVSGISPPYVLTGLLNDTQYAFTVTSSKGSSKVGPFSPVETATPRLLSPSVAWTVGTPLSGNDLHSIAFSGSTYVTVGDAATVFAAQYYYPGVGGVDATGWRSATTLPVGLTANLNSVAYDGARFIALGNDGSIIKSTDAEALLWEAVTAIAGAPTMNVLAIGVGLYVAVGDTGAIYTSSDSATTWTARASGTASNLYGISYVNGTYVAVGASGTLLTSTDAVTWTTQASMTGSNLRGVTYGANTYVAVGDNGAIVSSADATTWAVQTGPTAESFRAVSFGPDEQFIAVGTSSVNAYSSTGADGSWLSSTTNAGSIDLNAIAPNLLYIAVGAAGANVSGK